MISVVVSSAGSGVCEPTNQSRLGIQEEGPYRDRMRTLMCFLFFFYIKGCKPIGVVTQNQTFNPSNEDNMSLLVINLTTITNQILFCTCCQS